MIYESLGFERAPGEDATLIVGRIEEVLGGMDFKPVWGYFDQLSSFLTKGYERSEPEAVVVLHSAPRGDHRIIFEDEQGIEKPVGTVLHCHSETGLSMLIENRIRQMGQDHEHSAEPA